MEQVPVTIEIAGAHNARVMAELKFENVMHRVGKNELEMSHDEIEREKVTEESVRSLAETLAQSNEDDYYLVAKRLGEVVGFCRMTWRPDAKRFQFKQFYVLPRYIGKKIGSKLVAAAKERSLHSEHNSDGIFLYTGDYNKAAQAMYEHLGFRRTSHDESKFEQWDNRKVEWMRMVLHFQPSDHGQEP